MREKPYRSYRPSQATTQDKAYQAGLVKGKSDIENSSEEDVYALIEKKKGEEYAVHYLLGFKAGKEYLISTNQSPFYFYGKIRGRSYANDLLKECVEWESFSAKCSDTINKHILKMEPLDEVEYKKGFLEAATIAFNNNKNGYRKWRQGIKRKAEDTTNEVIEENNRVAKKPKLNDYPLEQAIIADAQPKLPSFATIEANIAAFQAGRLFYHHPFFITKNKARSMPPEWPALNKK